MIMQISTDDMILEDIKEFEKLIQIAEGQISEFPPIAETWQARKKLKEKRRILTSEIEHVKRLIGIAEGAITDV